jgi:hypothetical protein
MRSAQRALLSLVEKIFADGILSPSERKELHSLYGASGLSVREVREVFSAFVAKTWGQVMEDSFVTAEERQKLLTIIVELRLPPEMVPPEVAREIVRLAA